jgi:hypothetical protein
MFTNVTKSTEATADKVIAGSRPLMKSITQPSTRDVFTIFNLMGTSRGLVLVNTAALLSRIDLSLARAASGGPGVEVTVKSGANFNSTTNVATILIPSGQTTVSEVVNFTVPAGHGLFIAVNKIGQIVRGRGLNVSFTYFTV